MRAAKQIIVGHQHGIVVLDEHALRRTALLALGDNVDGVLRRAFERGTKPTAGRQIAQHGTIDRRQGRQFGAFVGDDLLQDHGRACWCGLDFGKVEKAAVEA